ncbi:2'-5' RNA ligase family protein [Tessaracoccus caeni]|uniref:2'-5' RNA ligase family protein n=1 Tax=Tessaracoccus caeni TaxID=3031239 RepID=UPI0023DA46A8|nr:2'-5' RNA ligase family protein [Tessaracoccus caeni]MDF1487779.1 2'-5' RNA ligase family protein [Tessaracoccus caeni]
MRNFFESMEPWRQPEGSLHLYVLPDDDVRERLVSAQEALTGIEHLPLMPPAYLHMTVHRLSQFDDLPQVEFSRLAQHLTPLFDSFPAFTVDMGAPELHETSVGVTASPSAEWDSLIDGVRRTLSEAFPGDDLLFPPHAPHLSLGYATGPASDDEVRARLKDQPPIGDVRIGTVELVSVTVRPDLGIFDFTGLAAWPLP